MRNIFRYLQVAACLLPLAACQKFGDDVSYPDVSVRIEPSSPKVGETVRIYVESDAQYVTLFTGDDGHRFERSRIKAIMDHDWDSFKDTVYRLSYAKNGEKQTYYRYFKDYNTLEEVYEDFEFFGAYANVELVRYDEDDFPEALMQMSYPGTNQLKFTVTDRRIPTGIRIKPDIHLFGGAENQPGFSTIESRYVACEEDKAVRAFSNDPKVPAYFGLHTEQLEAEGSYPAGYEYYMCAQVGDRYWGAFQTNDPLSGRPTEGFYKLSDMYSGDAYLAPFLDCGEKLVIRQIDIYSTYRCTRPAAETSQWQYDLDGDGQMEYYECELDPDTGLPVRESDYVYYTGFQGDVYLSFLEMGSNEYEPWNTGVNLGSVYSTGGIAKVYEYVYTGEGEFTVTAVATNVGNKQHSGIDYDEDRGNSPDNYPALRSTASVSVNVTE